MTNKCTHFLSEMSTKGIHVDGLHRMSFLTRGGVHLIAIMLDSVSTKKGIDFSIDAFLL